MFWLDSKILKIKANMSPFDFLQNKDIYAEGKGSGGDLIAQARSIYKLLLVIGTIGLVTSLVIAGIRISFARKSGQKIHEALESAVFKLLASCLLFSGMALLGLYHTFLYQFDS